MVCVTVVHHLQKTRCRVRVTCGADGDLPNLPHGLPFAATALPIATDGEGYLPRNPAAFMQLLSSLVYGFSSLAESFRVKNRPEVTKFVRF